VGTQVQGPREVTLTGNKQETVVRGRGFSNANVVTSMMVRSKATACHITERGRREKKRDPGPNVSAFQRRRQEGTGREAEPRCWWLLPIVLATQEAEIRRITVQSQPGQRVHMSLALSHSTCPVLTLVTSTQLRAQCTHILSISLALGCKMISGAVKIVSAWNRGMRPRIKELKDCRFLQGASGRKSGLTRVSDMSLSN
jgi:hypothetical protein